MKASLWIKENCIVRAPWMLLSDSKQKLMVCVSINHDELYGISNISSRARVQTLRLWSLQRQLRRTFIKSDVVNLVHYSARYGREIAMLVDMMKIYRLAGPNLHGFQLDIPWPSISDLNECRLAIGKDFFIILQLGQEAIIEAGETTQDVVDALYNYKELVNGILLDIRGFSTKRAIELLCAIEGQGWDIGIMSDKSHPFFSKSLIRINLRNSAM